MFGFGSVIQCYVSLRDPPQPTVAVATDHTNVVILLP